uniref:Uncharacterized protein n=1 Tax=Octopus bimaculoides TaxID=37653 RepID=A0A0L8GUZ3_OCTBM
MKKSSDLFSISQSRFISSCWGFLVYILFIMVLKAFRGIRDIPTPLRPFLFIFCFFSLRE